MNRNEKIILLKWLQRGYIETDDLPQLNEAKNNWFSELVKRRTKVTTNKNKQV